MFRASQGFPPSWIQACHGCLLIRIRTSPRERKNGNEGKGYLSCCSQFSEYSYSATTSQTPLRGRVLSSHPPTPLFACRMTPCVLHGDRHTRYQYQHGYMRPGPLSATRYLRPARDTQCPSPCLLPATRAAVTCDPHCCPLPAVIPFPQAVTCMRLPATRTDTSYPRTPPVTRVPDTCEPHGYPMIP